jgi:gliding motility-associated lipoprotein GldH
MTIKSNFLNLFAVFVLFSCDEKRVFDDYKSIDSSWNKDSIVSFDFPKLDSKKKYNLFLTLRGNNDYPYNNLFLIVNLDQPGGLTKVDTLEYEMADPEGNLLGNGFTDVKESKLVYKENVSVKEGNYKIHIKHAVRKTGKIIGDEKLKGITEVGFRIETTQ